MILTRRNLIKTASLLGLGSVSGFTVLSVERAKADDRVFKHGTQYLGELKYPPDFKHFDYVNPDAPKGGRLRLGVVGSFDSLNPFIIKGEMAGGPGLHDRNPDDRRAPTRWASEYGLIAESVYHPDDFSSVILPAAQGSALA